MEGNSLEDDIDLQFESMDFTNRRGLNGVRASFGPFSCCNMFTVTCSAGMIDSGNVELIIGAKKH